MSVWASVKGQARINLDSGFSFRTYIIENFESAQPHIEHEKMSTERLLVNFQFNFIGGGEDAANQIQSMIKAIKERDRNAWVDISAGIRFLG